MVLPGAIGRLLRRELSRRIFVQPIQLPALGVPTCVTRQARSQLGADEADRRAGQAWAPAVKGETSSLQVGICSSSRDSEPLRVLCDALNCSDIPIHTTPSPSTSHYSHLSYHYTLLQRHLLHLQSCVSSTLQVSASPPISRSWTLALPKKLPAIQGSAPAPCSRAASDFL